MRAGLAIAGTDTDAGKSFVTAALLAWLARQGHRPAPMKPVQTGATPASDGGWHAPDLDFALAAAGLRVDAATYRAMAPNCFAPAASPHIAARLDGGAVDRAAVQRSAAWLAARYNPVIAEGAGGLLVPLGDGGYMVDLLAELDWPVLVVGRAGLGTLNHTLLSLEALARRGLAVAGTVLAATSTDPGPAWLIRDNVATLQSLGNTPCFGVLDHVPSGAPSELADAVAKLPALTAYLSRG